MKYKLIYILLISLSACSLPRKFIKNDDICSFNDKINPNDFILDTSYIKLIQDERLYYDIYNNKTKRKRIMYDDDNGEYVLNERNKKSKIIKWLNYNDSLQLTKSHFNYKLDNYLDIGVKKYYDKKGNIIKTIDYRQKNKYPICYREAYRIVEKWKPKSYIINHLERDFIVEGKDTIYTWDIHIKDLGTPKRKSFLYTINAKNGKKIKKSQTVVICND